MSNIQASSDHNRKSAPADGSGRLPKPPWLKVRLPAHSNFFQVSDILKKNHLQTICQSAKCPNIAECWTARTATFLILGDTCTRSCGFCAVKKGTPLAFLDDEPSKVANAVESLGLDYAVVTSVTRDDLTDGGASIFARTIRAIKDRRPRAKVEVLIPDFGGSEEALATVIAAEPNVLNHNLETTETNYPRINRPAGNYGRSLAVLKRAGYLGALTKSGLMVGLGETEVELDQTLQDLRSVGCRILTIGQYLQPTRDNPPVSRYYSPEEFEALRVRALGLGFKEVAAGPLVRSSYHAHRLYRSSAAGDA
ncbi:MAG: lipoyl synthase [Candidatus Aminicenantales bacterium]